MATSPHITPPAKNADRRAAPHAEAPKREEDERQQLLAKIKSEIDWLQFGPQSEEIRDIIRQLQGLQSDLRSGVQRDLMAAKAIFSRIEVQARHEQAIATSKETTEMIRAITTAQQAEFYYRDLSEAARRRVDTVYELLSKPHLTQEEIVTVIQNIAGESELAGPIAARNAAARVARANPELVEELRRHPKEARTAQIIVENNKQELDKEAQKHPEARKQLKEIKEFGDSSTVLVEKVKACNGNCQKIEAVKEEVHTQYRQQMERRYQYYLSQISAEGQAILKQESPREVVRRIRAMTGDEARLAAARSYNEHAYDSASDEVKKDAAALELHNFKQAEQTSQLIGELARRQEKQQVLTQREQDIINPNLSIQQRSELIAQELEARTEARRNTYRSAHPVEAGEQGAGVVEAKRSGPATKSAAYQRYDDNLIMSTLKAIDSRPDKTKSIADMTDAELREISKAAVKGASTMMAENFFETDTKKTQAVLQVVKAEAYISAKKEGLTEKEARDAAQSAEGRARFGANVKNTLVHAINLDAEKAKESAKAAATQVVTKTGSLIDDMTLAMGFKTDDNQIHRHMDFINSVAAYRNVTNGNGQKIFDTEVNGKISQKELTEVLSKHGFKTTADFGNHDDEITREEMQKALQTIIAKERKIGMAQKIDAVAKQLIDKDFAQDLKNSNITFSAEEIKRLDANGDGKLDLNDKEKIAKLLKEKNIDLNGFDKNRDGIDVKELAEAMHTAAAVPKPNQPAKQR